MQDGENACVSGIQAEEHQGVEELVGEVRGGRFGVGVGDVESDGLIPGDELGGGAGVGAAGEHGTNGNGQGDERVAVDGEDEIAAVGRSAELVAGGLFTNGVIQKFPGSSFEEVPAEDGRELRKERCDAIHHGGGRLGSEPGAGFVVAGDVDVGQTIDEKKSPFEVDGAFQVPDEFDFRGAVPVTHAALEDGPVYGVADAVGEIADEDQGLGLEGQVAEGEVGKDEAGGRVGGGGDGGRGGRSGGGGRTGGGSRVGRRGWRRCRGRGRGEGRRGGGADGGGWWDRNRR